MHEKKQYERFITDICLKLNKNNQIKSICNTTMNYDLLRICNMLLIFAH